MISGGGLDSKARLRQIEQYRPDVILATPTYALYLGETARAARIRSALDRVLRTRIVRTRDLGGTATTTEFTEAICREIEK